MHAPKWSRLLYRASRALTALDVAQQIVRDELLFAFLDPKVRDSLTFDAYAQSRGYVEGGEQFVQGLFAWETALLEDERVPRSGRVLLGAAGGGRELRGLLDRGYDVFAFEPVAPFLRSARKVAGNSHAVLVQASYQDLVTRAADKPGPLDGLRGRVDLCVLGWGSMSHLTEPNSALETLRALRALAPEAPVIASFILLRKGTPDVRGGARKLRRTLRRALETASRSRVPAGLRFVTSCGFYYEFSQIELTAMCAQAGYEIARFSELPHPHALLLPSLVSDRV